MNTLYFLHYNNYYNRIIKKHNTIQEYVDENNSTVRLKSNFIPGDGVHTEQVVNFKEDDFFPDYVVVADDAGVNIISRWFVLSIDRLSGVQYHMILKRDSIADNYNIVIKSPVFIEKATVSPEDPAIYNKEQMTYNQIKRSETTILDASKIPWIVGYISRNYNEKAKFKVSTYCDKEYTQKENYPYYNYLDKKILNSSGNINLIWPIKFTNPLTKKTVYLTYGISNNNVYYEKNSLIDYNNHDNVGTIDYYSREAIKNTLDLYIKTNPRPNLFTNYQKTNYQIETQSIYNQLLAENGKYYKIGDLYYKAVANIVYADLLSDKYPSEGTEIKYIRTISTLNAAENCYGYYQDNYITLSLELVSNIPSGDFEIDFSKDRTHCSDQPYDVFCMPYGNYKTYFNNAIISASAQTNLAIATGIASIGQSLIYDIQLLPYCPLLKVEEHSKTITNATDIGIVYNTETETPVNYKACIYWCSRSTFSFQKQFYNKINNIKLSNETEFERLTSPNYNGSFEFSPAKNVKPGSLEAYTYFNIDCQYKPYTPYIHIAPNFGGLYGKNFNDPRGLICGGDFSLPNITDQWANYQLNNKNFQNSFDRQIQSMELKNNLSRVADISNIILGTTGGAVAGLKAGGIGGSIAGGLTAGIKTGASAITNEIERRDKLDLTKDQFGFQMGNIQALPNTLNKVGTFNNNNKIFPILESYGCTQEELDALKLKLYYNGMTVGRIGTIEEFLQPEKSYIKGHLIRLVDSNGDIEETPAEFNEVNDISNELNQGVFI